MLEDQMNISYNLFKRINIYRIGILIQPIKHKNLTLQALLDALSVSIDHVFLLIRNNVWLLDLMIKIILFKIPG